MEGYFRAKEYAKLEDIDYNAVMKRVERKQVKYFKEPDTGNVYIYWSYEANRVPEGFVPMYLFAKQHHVSLQTISRLVYDGRIAESYIFRKQVGKRTYHYIKEDAVPIMHDTQSVIKFNKPDGYISLREWYEKNGTTRDNASQMIYHNRIRYIKHKGHIYIPEDEPYPKRKIKGFELESCKHVPDGFLPIREWCKKYKQNYKSIYWQCYLESFPNRKVGKYRYIQDLPKEAILNDHQAGGG